MKLHSIDTETIKNIVWTVAGIAVAVAIVILVATHIRL